MLNRIYSMGQSVSSWLYPTPEPKGTSAKRKHTAKLRRKNGGKTPAPIQKSKPEEKSVPETQGSSSIHSTSKGILLALLFNKIIGAMSANRLDFAIKNSTELFAVVKSLNLDFSSDEQQQLQSFFQNSTCNITAAISNSGLGDKITDLCSGYGTPVSLYSLSQTLTEDSSAVLQCVIDQINRLDDSSFCYENFLDVGTKEAVLTVAGVVGGLAGLVLLLIIICCIASAIYDVCAEKRRTAHIKAIVENKNLPGDVNVLIAQYAEEQWGIEAKQMLENTRERANARRPASAEPAFRFFAAAAPGSDRTNHIEMTTLSNEIEIEEKQPPGLSSIKIE